MENRLIFSFVAISFVVISKDLCLRFFFSRGDFTNEVPYFVQKKLKSAILNDILTFLSHFLLNSCHAKDLI